MDKCPITYEPIKSNDCFIFKSKSKKDFKYSRRAIAKYIDSRGDLRDPMTREPLDSDSLNGVQSKVMKKLGRFWRAYMSRGVAKTLLRTGMKLYCHVAVEDTISLLHASAGQLLHLCRPRYRRIRKQLLSMAPCQDSRMVMRALLDCVEHYLNNDYALHLRFNGFGCTMCMIRPDGKSDNITREFPRMRFHADTDFARALSRDPRMLQGVSIVDYDESSING